MRIRQYMIALIVVVVAIFTSAQPKSKASIRMAVWPDPYGMTAWGISPLGTRLAARPAMRAITIEEDKMLTLHLRAQLEQQPGMWKTVETKRQVPASNVAIVICDMWDKHWCASATRRCEEIAKRMEPAIEAARSKGVLIIHAPSECMKSYENTPQRKLAISAPKASPPAPRKFDEPALPIDDSDGGCDDVPQCKQGQAWTKENPNLHIAEGDAISDNGQEIYNLLKARNIHTLLVMGVHTNMCVLGRSFAIRQMTKWDIPCVLVRDLTDTMYNPRMRPMVPHEEGTKLVVEHIEKYWCPTITSKDLLKK